MTVLIISASPRRDGNSERLLREVLAGIEGVGLETRTIRTHGMNIEPCDGCDICGATGRCVIKDSFTDIRDVFIACRGIVFVTPLYFMNVPSRGKAFIDRCQEFWMARHQRKENLFGDTRRYGLLVASAGAKRGPGGADIFRGLRDTMTYVFDALGIDDFDEMLVNNLEKHDVREMPGVLAAARRKGRVLATRLLADG